MGFRECLRTILGCAALVLAAAVAPAGMGPGRGLPANWDITETRGFGDLNGLSGNPISAMCVECHTVNPSATILPGPTLRVHPFGESDPPYRGTHFVRHWLDAVWRATVNPPTAPEKVDAWASGEVSRYGNFAIPASTPGVRGDMICESCHNLVKNVVDSASDNDLLLDVYDKSTGAATLCRGCHSGITGPPNHHPLGAADSANDAAVRNPPIDPAKTDGVRFFGSPNVVSCLSCHKVHGAVTATGARVLRRGAAQTTGIPGVFERPANVVYYAGRPPTFLGGAVSYAVGDQVNYSQATGSAAPNRVGLYRQAEYTPFGGRAVFEAGPLCDACHRY